MDIIYIQDLRVDAVIGEHAWEQRIRQRLRIDLEIAVDASLAAASDCLADALDYSVVAREVHELVTASRVKLLETLAEQIARQVLSHESVDWVRVGLAKPGALPQAANVRLVIERGTRAP